MRIKILEDKRMMIALAVTSICILPWLLNQLGLSFASTSTRLTAETIAQNGIRADDLFLSLRGALHHALLEWSAVSVALIAFGVSMLHYKKMGDVTIPIIGMSLLAAAGMDTFHTLAAMRIVEATASNVDFIPFTWALSRIFNATVMVFGLTLSIWIAHRTYIESGGISGRVNDQQPQKQNHFLHRQSTLIVAGAFLILFSYIIVSFAGSSESLPTTMYPRSMIVRPFDVLPLALFFFVGTMAWNWYTTNPSSLKLALVISIIPEISTQLYMAFGSTALFDNAFNIAHFLKIVAYACVLVGLIVELSDSKQRGEINKPSSNASTAMSKKKPLEGKLEVGVAGQSLLIKAPLAIFTLSIGIALMSSFGFYHESERLFYENVENSLKNESGVIKPFVSKLYGQMSADVIFLSRLPPIPEIVRAAESDRAEGLQIWQKRLEKILTEMILVNPDYLEIALISVADVEQDIVRISKTNHGVVAVPSRMKQQHPISELGRLSDEINLGVANFSTIHLERNKGDLINPLQPVLQVATPIFDSQGNRFGMIVITGNFDVFVQTLKSELPEDHSLLIANDNGDYIVHQIKDREFGFERGESILMQADFPELQSVFDAGKSNHVVYDIGTAIDNNVPIGRYQLLRFDEYGVSHPLRLFLAYDYQLIQAQLIELRNKSLLLGLSLAFIALALAILFSRRMMKPLMQVTLAVEEYDRSGSIGELPLSAKDELGVLARSFHNFALQVDTASEEQQDLITAAQRSSLQLGAIVDAVAQAIINIDSRGKIVTFNRSAEKIFGYSINEVVGKNVKILMLESDAVNHDGYLSHYSISGETNIIGTGRGLKGQRKNGEIFPMFLDISEVELDGHKTFIGFVRDLSQEAAIEKQRQFAMTVLEASMDMTDNALLVTNNKDMGLRGNGRFLEMFDVTSDIIDDQPLLMLREMILSNFCNPEMYFDIIEEVQSTEKDWSGTFNLKDGRIIECLTLCRRVDGERDIRVWSFRDVTQRMNYENQMLEAKEKAEQAAAAKSDFLASMSHEIRTPMNGVLGMLGLLRNEDLTQSQERKARVAQESAKSLLYLINDILDFSKIEAEKLDLETLDFNLRSLLDDFMESMALRAQEKGIELVLDLRGIELSMVKGDPGRIRQIVTNLVGNALKFTEKGEITVRAILEVEGDECLFHCEIIDTGMGIHPDKIDTLFDSFTQVDASTTRKFGGTGLGLAIVQRLVNLMDGTVEVLSEVGKGTCFTFNIKLKTSKQAEEVVPNVSIDGARILIVDDHAINREVLGAQLAHWGASVTESDSGQNALSCLEEFSGDEHHQFQIAFIDMNMPDMDGASLGKLIRGNPSFNHVKLVLMTAISNRGDAKHFADLGFSAYFPKPITTSDIFDTLAVLLDEGELETQASPLITSHFLRGLVHEEKPEKVAPHSDGELYPERLLLVEDNEINQLVATEILEDLGISADVAINGVEALKALKEAGKDERFTIILMDCQMPEMDGYEATEAIRRGDAGPENADIPIIAMTANAMVGDKERCMEAGMSDYLTKPIDVEALESMLHHWGGDNLFLTGVIDGGQDLTNVIVWDRDAALKRMMGQDPRLRRIVQVMVDEIPNNMTELKCAIEDENLENARQIANMIEGVAANLSGGQLQKVMRKCEVACADNDLSQVNKIYFSECAQEYENLLEALNLYLES